MEADPILWLVAAALVITGIAGLLLPAIPGALLLLLGLLVAAWAEGFVHVGFWTLAILAVMALLTYGVDFAAAAFGARKFGATPRAAIGAAIGTLIGLFFGLPGILLGPFLGAMAGELLGRRSVEQAGRAGFGATVGLVVGAAVKVALAFAMLGVFLVARFSGA